MPPCAQTECERLTGTTEIRSTSCPASAIFIAAAKPASPPPTIAIFKPVAMELYFPASLRRPVSREPRLRTQRIRHQPARPDKTDRCIDTRHAQKHRERQRGVERNLLGL